MREGTITMPDGRQLGYGEHGDPGGMPIIYNHPMPGSRAFNLDPEALKAHGARVLSLERPGLGLSTRAPGRTLGDWAADVLACADALGFERFAVVAVSAGGPYGWVVAHDAPDRVTRLGLVCASGPILEHPEFDEQLEGQLKALLPLARQDPQTAEALLREFLAASGESYRNDPDRFFAEWLQGWPEDQRPLYREAKDRWMSAIEAVYRDTEGFADDIVAGLQWTFDPTDIRVPVRAWHGTSDKSAPMGLTRLAVDRARGELVEYEGVGHYLGPEYHDEWIRWLVREE
jgi:pimeloyl-ACP methyl ester carboxylesterase